MGWIWDFDGDEGIVTIDGTRFHVTVYHMPVVPANRGRRKLAAAGEAEVVAEPLPRPYWSLHVSREGSTQRGLAHYGEKPSRADVTAAITELL